MFFTQEDYKKIEAWLYQRTVKDTEFPKANPLGGTEMIPIVQDDRNKLIGFNDVVREVALKRPQDFYNIHTVTNKNRLCLCEAIALVPDNQKKSGLVITFCNEYGNWVIYQFIGESLNQWDSHYCWENIVHQALKELIFWPDEEDITFVQDGNKKFLKFRDREYDPDVFLNMGMTILRRNYKGTEACAIDDEDHLINLLTQDMISQPNTVYVIEYDFDLDGKSISIPENCVLWFQGGSINNGSIYLQETAILGAFEFADTGDSKLFGTFNTGQVFTFSDDSYMKKSGGYFTSAVLDEDKETFTPAPVNSKAYTKNVRQELRWWNGEEWLLVLDITDLNELKSIISDLTDKHNKELSQVFQYFKERCTRLETRMTNAETRLTNAEIRLDGHDNTLALHEARIGNAETRLTNAEIRVTNTELRLNNHDTVLSNHEERISNSETRLTNAENRITNTEKRLDGHDTDLANHEDRITKSETRLTNVENRATKLEDNLGAEIERATRREDEIAERLRTFLEDVDVKDTTINKWTEIQKFLEGITDTDTLTNLLAEVSRKAKEDNDKVAQDLAKEIERAIKEESRLESKIDTEISERKSADSTLQSNIDTERERAKAEEKRIEDKLDAEITRAKKAESDEETARKSADENLQRQVTTNTTNISNIQTTVNNHSSSINNIDSRLSTTENNVTNLQSSVSTLQTNVSNIQNSITNLQNAVNNLGTTINNQINEYLSNNVVGAKSVTVNGTKYNMDSSGNITLPDYPSSSGGNSGDTTVSTNADTVDNYHVSVLTKAQYNMMEKDSNTIYFVKP